MSTLRKVARDMARSQSYKQSHTTDMFHYFFNKIWREKAGHEASNNMSPTKVPLSKRVAENAKRRRKEK